MLPSHNQGFGQPSHVGKKHPDLKREAAEDRMKVKTGARTPLEIMQLTDGEAWITTT